MKKTIRTERGFTLLETVVVIGVMMVLMGIAIIQSFGSMESYQVNSAQDVVVSQLRVARQLAITNRRTVQVWIDTSPESDGHYHVKYQVQPAPQTNEVAGPIVSVPMPGTAQFILETGVPDTPMAFGNSAPVFIGNPPVSGGPPIMQFNPTGTFTDNTGTNVIYGTVFIGVPNKMATARAVTIMGGTGRVRAYTYAGGGIGWQE
ncbi:MAG: prepilin-type N-terminal cleavage/methylation domain-containing protein [Candidatus Acidiferrum sp.]|jgi:type II secretory pathway pseudopilin PulG